MGATKTKTISTPTRVIMIAINVLLVGVFAWNISRLLDIHEQVRATISQPILSANPGEFLAKLEASDVQWWMWVIIISAAAISLAFIASLIIPSLNRYHYHVAVATSVWLGLWLVYVAGVVAVALLALNRLFVT